MTEAVHELAPVDAPPATVAAAGERVRAAVAGLSSLDGARDAAVEHAVQVFQQVGSGGADQADVARALLSALDEKVLHGVETPTGVSARAEAIDAVIRLGYPWALQLDPEDVAFLRPARRAPVIRRWVKGVALVLAATAAVSGGWLAWTSYREAVPTPLPVVVLPIKPTPTPPELKTMLSSAELSALVTQAQQALERRDDRSARGPLQRCLEADGAQLTCLRLLAEVETRQAQGDHDPTALERAHDLARRYLHHAPPDDALRGRVEGVLLEEMPPPVTTAPTRP